MSDWESAVTEALGDLGADQVMVPGAKLRAKMMQMAPETGIDVGEHVASSAQSFSRLVGQVEGVEVQRRPGSDVLIGIGDARPPEPEIGVRTRRSVGSLRRDVYEAFTQLSRTKFVYLPDSDRFVRESEAEGASIPLPETTLEQLIKDRESFTQTLDAALQEPLLDALARSASPLSAFRTVLSESDLVRAWVSTQANVIRERVVEWAGEKGIEPRAAWFSRRDSQPNSRAVLARLIPYLTPEEIRELRIPFRAVEALLSDVSRG